MGTREFIIWLGDLGVSQPPQFSDDRRWWWNGTEWRPASEYAGPPIAYPSPPSQLPQPQAAPKYPQTPYGQVPQYVSATQVNVATNSASATWSMILGILSWFLCPFAGAFVAIFLGHSARGEMKRNPQLVGGGMATAGLILGYAHLAVYGLILLIFLSVCGGLAAATTATPR